MEKAVFLLVLFISIMLIFGLYFLNLTKITGMFIGFGQAQDADWWNVSWHYRIRLEINSTGYNRKDWLIEREINFTDLIPFGTFDINSTRVFEYSQAGSLLYEVTSQFDEDNNYDSSTNALGTLIFVMNGTTPANTNRTFYIYYDTIENGAKDSPNYPTNLNYDDSLAGGEFNVNNSILAFWVDTEREDYTSGLYRVK